MRSPDAVRIVAYVEALKGALVLVAATGVLSLIHRDVHALAATLIEHAHLNPASKYPKIFLDAAANIGDTRLVALACGAAAYSLLRFVEAYGLFHGRAWAELLAAASGAIYVPFELYGLWMAPSWHGAALLLINLAVVGLMIRALRRRSGVRSSSATHL